MIAPDSPALFNRQCPSRRIARPLGITAAGRVVAELGPIHREVPILRAEPTEIEGPAPGIAGEIIETGAGGMGSVTSVSGVVQERAPESVTLEMSLSMPPPNARASAELHHPPLDWDRWRGFLAPQGFIPRDGPPDHREIGAVRDRYASSPCPASKAAGGALEALPLSSLGDIMLDRRILEHHE